MNNISHGLELKQSQNLVMTPQLRQAIEILQLNNIELANLIEEEISKNPFLEKEAGGSESFSDGDVSHNPDNAGDRVTEKPESDVESSGLSISEDDNISQSFALNNDYESAEIYGRGGSGSFDNSEFDLIETAIAEEKNLRNHLSEQINACFYDEKERLTASLLVDFLDDSGFLRESSEDLAKRLSCSVTHISKIIAKLKQFDPTGIFAKDVKECFSIQLKERNLLDDAMFLLIENIDLLAKYDRKKLCSVCKVSPEKLDEMIVEMRRLNPNPASEFEHVVVQTRIPDVLMKALPKHEGGGWKVELNPETLPSVLVNNDYYIQVCGSLSKDREGKKYVEDCMTAANWLIRALEQRANTILKVSSSIIEEQNGFFLYGIEYMRPMTLRDIAEKIEMHESTVSRVTNGKYIYTPRGIFELKYFFTSSVGGSKGSGSDHSSNAIKAKISALIKSETAENILSDDRIVEILKKEGISIARRTITKYREALGIPSSSKRKRMM